MPVISIILNNVHNNTYRTSPSRECTFTLYQYTTSGGNIKETKNEKRITEFLKTTSRVRSPLDERWLGTQHALRAPVVHSGTITSLRLASVRLSSGTAPPAESIRSVTGGGSLLSFFICPYKGRERRSWG